MRQLRASEVQGGATYLDPIVLVQYAPDQLAADVDTLLFLVDDRVQRLKKLDDTTPNTQSSVLR